MSSLVLPEPAPIPNDRPAVWDLVISDMVARDAEGSRKYGTPLQPFNGRAALVDLYQELLDACVYVRQALYERDHEEDQGYAAQLATTLRLLKATLQFASRDDGSCRACNCSFECSTDHLTKCSCEICNAVAWVRTI